MKRTFSYFITLLICGCCRVVEEESSTEKVLNSLGTDDNRWVVQFEKQPERITTNRYCGLKFEEVIQQLGTPNEITYPSSNMVQWISGQVGIQAPTTSVVVLLYDTHSQIGGETYILLQTSSNMIERVLGDIEIPPGVLM